MPLGLYDPSGLPIGNPVTTPPTPPSLSAVGFLSLFDFTGLPVGVPAPVAAARSGMTVGGKRRRQRLIRAMVEQERYRQMVDMQSRRVRSRLQQDKRKELAEKFHDMEQKHQEQITVAATYTILLAEV